MHHMAPAVIRESPLCCVRYVHLQMLLISSISSDDRAKSLSELGDANEQLV